jgi:hypothetical protein
MNRRKAAIGVSVVCALCLSAFLVPGASAAGTTAAECSSLAEVKDFADAHCDREVGPEGAFGHIAFPNNKAIEVTAVNDLTGVASPFVLSGKLAGLVVHIQCETVAAAGAVTNEAPGGAMKLAFGAANANFENCRMTTPFPCEAAVGPSRAVVSDPMNLKRGATTTDITGNQLPEPVEEGGGTEMGLKFTAPAAMPLAVVMLFGPECPQALIGAFPVAGSAIATGGRGSVAAVSSSGATGIFTKASTIKFLKFAGNPATLEGTLTFRKRGENPLTITTTAV